MELILTYGNHDFELAIRSRYPVNGQSDSKMIAQNAALFSEKCCEMHPIFRNSAAKCYHFDVQEVA